MNVDHQQAALGAVLGALVGDAAGAVLEFLGRPIGAADVDRALGMPGGGHWRLAPGQVTDDGELTMSLLSAIADASDAGIPLRQAAGKRYAAWIDSRPFDVGTTTMRSLGCLRHPRWGARLLTDPAFPLCDLMQDAARELCMESQANGALMRVTPLGIWGAGRADYAAAEAAKADAELSHPHPTCTAVNGAYAEALASLVEAPGDARRAIERARRWLDHAGDATARGWLADAVAGVHVPYEPHIGHVRIAFVHAFRHLAAASTYADALRETLAGGGDTDTNACIVGGLLGARWGADAIPSTWREAVLTSDLTRGRARPDPLHPRHAPALVARALGLR